MHPSLYDPVLMEPSKLGIDYPLPIFTDAIGNDDVEHMRQTLFAAGNLVQPYHSINTDVRRYSRAPDYLMARNPSNGTYFITVMISTNPARRSKSMLPWVENGSRIPLRLWLLLTMSASLKPRSSLKSV
jgi:hypothetical protein